MTNLQPGKNGYISRRLLRTVIAFLDEKGVTTKIVKSRRQKNYFMYVHGVIYKDNTRTRQAQCRRVYQIYLKVLNTGKFDITK